MNYDILLLAVIAIVAVYMAFREGFRLGQGVSKGKEIKFPKIELPTKENREKKQEQREMDKAERIRLIELENIENYKTSVPQRKIK